MVRMNNSSLTVARPTDQTINLRAKLSREIIKSNPGLGSKALEMAEVLANSGISRALASMIVSAVYDPANRGLGQTTKAHWFVGALKASSYGNRLEYIGSNKNALQRFVAEMEDIDNSREALGTYCSFSFADMFLLAEAGVGESEAMAAMADLDALGKSQFQSKRILMLSARAVQSGQVSTLQCAIDQIL